MNYELLCEVLLEVLQEYRTQLQKLQSENKELQKKIDAEKIFNAYYTELQHERDQLAREIEDRKFNYGVLKNEHTNLLLHRNSLQAENNKLILERNSLQEGLQDAKSKLQLAQIAYNENRKLIAERDELQEKFERAKYELKIRNVIVIDDSIVRENNNG